MGRRHIVGRVFGVISSKWDFSCYIANLIYAFGACKKTISLNLRVLKMWLQRRVEWAIETSIIK